MSGLEKARLDMGLAKNEMASELCITLKEYERYELHIHTMPLPILKLTSFVTGQSMQFLLSEVL